MKRLLLTTAVILLTQIAVFAQNTEKQIDTPMRYYDVIKKLHMNANFKFITIPEKITQVYDNKGVLLYEHSDTSDYTFKLMPNMEILIDRKANDYGYPVNYRLALIKGNIVGHSVIDNIDAKRINVSGYSVNKFHETDTFKY